MPALVGRFEPAKEPTSKDARGLRADAAHSQGMPAIARARSGQPTGGQFVARRHQDATTTLRAPADPHGDMVRAREQLDRRAETVIAHEVSLRFPGAVRTVFIRDRIMGLTVPHSVYGAAGDEMFIDVDDEIKVELSKSLQPALRHLSYFGSDTFTIGDPADSRAQSGHD